MREKIMEAGNEAKNWYKNAGWCAAVLTVVGLIGGLMIHISTNYATVREMSKVDTQVYSIDHTMEEVAKTLSTLKTTVLMLNTSLTKRLDMIDDRIKDVDKRLDRIDNRLSRLEGAHMEGIK